MPANAVLVEAADALESPAREWPIFVDRASIVVAKKRAEAVSIGKHSLEDHVAIEIEWDIRRKRRESWWT